MRIEKLFRFVLLVIVVLLLTSTSVALMSFYLFEESSNVSSYALLVFLIIALVGLVLRKINLKNNSILIIAFIFSVVTLLLQLDDIVEESLVNKVHIILSVLAMPIGLIVGELLINEKRCFNSNHEVSDKRFSLFVVPIIASLYMFNSMEIKSPDSIFIILLLFPLIFFCRIQWLELAMFVFVGISCLQSAKRSVIIVYGLMLLFYFVYLRMRSKKNKFRMITFFILALSFAIGARYMAKDNNDVAEHVIDRFTDDETGGSGREGIYEQVWSRYQSSSLDEILFGHGYDAVKEQVSGISAHNDFLEILYDYGLISALIYCFLLLKIISLYIKLLRSRFNVFFERFLIKIILSFLLVLSMLNCIVTSAFYVFVIYLELGLTISILQKKVKVHR